MRQLIFAVAVLGLLFTVGCGDVASQDCTAPCAGDPIAEWSDTQGGDSGRWQYLADTRAVSGAAYSELTWGAVDGLPGWVAGDGAAIVNCAGLSDGACAGRSRSLVLFPGATSDPALAFVAATPGTLRIKGQVVSGGETPDGVSQRFRISRNGRHDLIAAPTYVTSLDAPSEIDLTVEALAGDRIVLSLVGGASAAPLAFDFHLSVATEADLAFPGKCLLAATFDATGALADGCGGRTLDDLNDNIGPAGTSAAGDSVTPAFGGARLLKAGQFLRAPGGPLDYSGDFTVQFWAKITEPQPFGSRVFADWSGDAEGGLSIGVADSVGIELCSLWRGVPADSDCPTGNRPRDGAWHFYRITRSLADTKLTLCIDGKLAVTDPGPGTADMTSDQSPHLGRNVNYNPAYFDGAIDDVRVFERALPCQTP